jgi:hypothetical protein
MSTFNRQRTYGAGERAQLRREEHVNEIAGRLRGLPFMSGAFLEDVALPGIRGRVKAIAGDVLTLWRAEDAGNFSNGQVIEAAATDGETGSKRAGTATVLKTDVAAGTVTATAAWNVGIPTIALDDYLFGEREFGPPVRTGAGAPDWSSGAVVKLFPGSAGFTGGVLVLARRGPRFPVLRTIDVVRTAPNMTLVALESRFATRADLVIY